MIDLKRFRKEKKLKQSEIAELTGLNRSSLSKYESGSNSETITQKLLEFYPESKDYMLTDIPISELRIRYEERETEVENLKKINLLLEEKVEMYKQLVEMAKAINKGK